jgi:PPM family protein phosphatase
MSDFELTSYGLSDLGVFRRRNEDALAQLKGLSFYVLADGMGGHKGGDVAASQAIHSVCSQARKHLSSNCEGIETIDQLKTLLKEFIKKANAHLFEMSKSDPSLKKMGTTLLMLLFWKGYALSVHVGDSRLYRLRGGALDQISSDHSLLRELKDSGIMLPKKDLRRARCILTRAVGTTPSVAPSVETVKVESKDVFLLCSDGLSDALSRDQIEEVLVSASTLKSAVQTLIQRAKKAGGKDNITALIVYCEPSYVSTVSESNLSR